MWSFSSITSLEEKTYVKLVNVTMRGRENKQSRKQCEREKEEERLEAVHEINVKKKKNTGDRDRASSRWTENTDQTGLVRFKMLC